MPSNQKLPTIKIKNQHEKLAALLYLSRISKKPISNNVLIETLANNYVEFFSNVCISHNEVTAWNERLFRESVEYVSISLEELYKYESYDDLVASLNKSELKLKAGKKIALQKNGVIFTVIGLGNSYVLLQEECSFIIMNEDRIKPYSADSLEEFATKILKEYPDAHVVE